MEQSVRVRVPPSAPNPSNSSSITINLIIRLFIKVNLIKKTVAHLKKLLRIFNQNAMLNLLSNPDNNLFNLLRFPTNTSAEITK